MNAKVNTFPAVLTYTTLRNLDEFTFIPDQLGLQLACFIKKFNLIRDIVALTLTFSVNGS